MGQKECTINPGSGVDMPKYTQPSSSGLRAIVIEVSGYIGSKLAKRFLEQRFEAVTMTTCGTRGREIYSDAGGLEFNLNKTSP